MHFDDRLGTVLQHRAAGERAARVQARQLFDLLGDPDSGADPALLRAAYRRLDTLAGTIPVGERERLAQECSARIGDARLLAWFATQEPRVALAALSRAPLTEERWIDLIPALPIRARGLLRHRRNLPQSVVDLLDRLGVQDRVLSDAASTVTDYDDAEIPATEDRPSEPVALDLGTYAGESYVIEPAAANAGEQAPPFAPPPPPPGGGNLGDLVRRIEAFQRARSRRDAGDPATVRPQSRNDDTADGAQEWTGRVAAFLFTTDVEGRVDWAEGVAGPMVVGMRLSTPGGPAPDQLGRAIAKRRPITGVSYDLAGAEPIAGEWIVDAAPRFDSRSGRYQGVVGRFRRPAPMPADTRALEAADRVRQLLHELRTPVTAIQGFAEVIQQQTVGPVPHEYRAVAAGIAGEAARMLAGFAEIERLARLEAGTHDLAEGESDFVAIVRRQIAQLQTVLSPRVSRIEARVALRSATVPLAADHAELIAWRVLATLAASTAAGEAMHVGLDTADKILRLSAQLPAALDQTADVFAAGVHPGGNALGIGLLGAGFALRLARAEARAVGGDLLRESQHGLVLILPLGKAACAPEDAPYRAAVPQDASPAPLAQSPSPR